MWYVLGTHSCHLTCFFWLKLDVMCRVPQTQLPLPEYFPPLLPRAFHFTHSFHIYALLPPLTHLPLTHLPFTHLPFTHLPLSTQSSTSKITLKIGQIWCILLQRVHMYVMGKGNQNQSSISLGQNQGEAGTPTGGSHHSRLVINRIANHNYKTKQLSQLTGKRDWSTGILSSQLLSHRILTENWCNNWSGQFLRNV